MFSAWRDSRRRRRARPHSHGVSSSSPFPSEGDDGPQSSPQRGNQGKKNPFKRSVGTSDAPHIDLQELIASESLKAGIEPDGDNTDNLRRRQRRVGESQKLRDRPVGNSADILASSSTQPLISFDNLNISDEVSTARPENGPSSERVVASPPRPFSVGTPTQTPVQAIQQSDASSSGGTPHPLDVRESIDSQTPSSSRYRTSPRPGQSSSLAISLRPSRWRLLSRRALDPPSLKRVCSAHQKHCQAIHTLLRTTKPSRPTQSTTRSPRRSL